MQAVRAVLAACALLTFATAAGAGPAPGTLRLAITSEPNNLDPAAHTQAVEYFLESLMFDSLFRTHADGSIEPDLARAVPTRANRGISADGRTITIHLRAGVKWHDGAPFGSADVAFTRAAETSSSNNAAAGDPADPIARLETPDPLTVVVHLKRPDSALLAEWGIAAIVPAHLLKTVANINDAAFGSAPVGTGPFVFDRWDRAREIVLRANDAYFEGPPAVRRIDVELVADDNSAAVAMRAGEIDMLYGPPPAMSGLVAGMPQMRFLAFDQNGVESVTMNTTRPAIGDRRVREAISLALDRRALTAKALRGIGTPAAGLTPSFTWAADATLRPVYDPPRSRQLLREAGWTAGPDGMFARDGRPLSLGLAYASGDGSIASAALLVQRMLRAVGIDAALRAVQPNVLYGPPDMGGILLGGKFDLALVGFFPSDDPDSSGQFACAERAPDGFNLARWCSPAYDALARAALTTYDRDARRALYGKIERLLNAEAPAAFLWWPKLTLIVRSDVKQIENPAHHDLNDPARWQR